MGKGRLFLWAVTSALAGFLFGFDTVVISGAEKQIQDIWSLSGSMHGWALSSALWGTVLGALCGVTGLIQDRSVVSCLQEKFIGKPKVLEINEKAFAAGKAAVAKKK